MLFNTKPAEQYFFYQLFMRDLFTWITQLSMNPRSNYINYHVCMEDGGGNGGKLGYGGNPKYYQFWKFGDRWFRHLDLGTTAANSCLYSWTTVKLLGLAIAD